jgi:8-oxo-dGTP diphosphatase
VTRDLAPTLGDDARPLPTPAADRAGQPTDDGDERRAAGREDAGPTTTLLVVRHGHAGDRERWEGPDEHRPLTKKGRDQAAGLVELLTRFDVGRILSSRYVRCLETVVPLACDRRRSIEVHPALAEGSSVLDVRTLVGELAGTTSVLCTHGDVIWNLLVGPGHHPGPADDDPPMAKGSTWVVEGSEGHLIATRYLPPPGRSD